MFVSKTIFLWFECTRLLSQW